MVQNIAAYFHYNNLNHITTNAPNGKGIIVKTKQKNKSKQVFSRFPAIAIPGRGGRKALCGGIFDGKITKMHIRLGAT